MKAVEANPEEVEADGTSCYPPCLQLLSLSTSQPKHGPGEPHGRYSESARSLRADNTKERMAQGVAGKPSMRPDSTL